MAHCLVFTTSILAIALAIGILGYHFIAGFPWIDALLNASMILTGMGPVGELTSTGAKLFASAYALFSGLVFITVIGVTLAPVLHRVLHEFHIDEDDFKAKGKG
jgi:hypothetical protein